MAKKNNRDGFSQATVRALEKEAQFLCSNPACRRPTRASTSDDNDDPIQIGVASHICAASRRGRRYDENMIPEERKRIRSLFQENDCLMDS